MKNCFLALVAVIVVVPVASAHEQPPTAPTALESFVAQPTVVLDLAEVVGAIRSTDATVSVAAIIATNTANPGERMTGLRFDLSDNGAAERVYLDISQLPQLSEDLAGIEGGIPELEASQAGVSVQGTGACWMPAQPTRILCPSYRVGPEWSGMGLFAYGGRGFDYPGERPAALLALVDRALAELGIPD